MQSSIGQNFILFSAILTKVNWERGEVLGVSLTRAMARVGPGLAPPMSVSTSKCFYRPKVRVLRVCVNERACVRLCERVYALLCESPSEQGQLTFTQSLGLTHKSAYTHSHKRTHALSFTQTRRVQ